MRPETKLERLGVLWCTFMHNAPTWPIHGQYECRTCGRHYRVPWAGPVTVLSLILMLTVLLPSGYAQRAMMESRTPVSTAFARYVASLEQPTLGEFEAIEIDASLPNEKHGRLRAIRRRLPFGKPDYQVLEIDGDQTVRQQVIARYLSGEARAAAIPSSSVAITPANYKFRQQGFIGVGRTSAYVFQITPRRKGEGLIKGELWIDAETGLVVRLSGYLVKRPSVFVRHVDMTRETDLRDGIAVTRVTHLSVDTRLIGRAELTIQERPCTSCYASEVVTLDVAQR